MRRIVQGRKKQGDITAVLLHEASEIWSDNWCIPSTAPAPGRRARLDQLAARPRRTAVTEMEYHNYAIPIPSALSQLPPSLSKDPLFNVPKSYTDNYQYILNVSPQVVQERTQIYTQFQRRLMADAETTPPTGEPGSDAGADRSARATRPG